MVDNKRSFPRWIRWRVRTVFETACDFTTERSRLTVLFIFSVGVGDVTGFFSGWSLLNRNRTVSLLLGLNGFVKRRFNRSNQFQPDTRRRFHRSNQFPPVINRRFNWSNQLQSDISRRFNNWNKNSINSTIRFKKYPRECLINGYNQFWKSSPSFWKIPSNRFKPDEASTIALYTSLREVLISEFGFISSV